MDGMERLLNPLKRTASYYASRYFLEQVSEIARKFMQGNFEDMNSQALEEMIEKRENEEPETTVNVKDIEQEADNLAIEGSDSEQNDVDLTQEQEENRDNGGMFE